MGGPGLSQVFTLDPKSNAAKVVVYSVIGFFSVWFVLATESISDDRKTEIFLSKHKVARVIVFYFLVFFFLHFEGEYALLYRMSTSFFISGLYLLLIEDTI